MSRTNLETGHSELFLAFSPLLPRLTRPPWSAGLISGPLNLLCRAHLFPGEWGGRVCLGGQTTWVCTLVLPLSSCVSLGKLQNFSVLTFFSVNRDNNSTYQEVVCVL